MVKYENPIGIIFQMDGDMQAAQTDMALAEAKNAARRHAQRMKAYADWVKPEAIEERRKQHEAATEAALLLGLQAARVLEDIPIPNPLPKHMEGQPLSTIRAMLRNGLGKAMPKDARGPLIVSPTKSPTFSVRPKSSKDLSPQEFSDWWNT